MTRWQCRGCALMTGNPCVIIVYEDRSLFPDVCPITGVDMVFIEMTDEEVV